MRGSTDQPRCAITALAAGRCASTRAGAIRSDPLTWRGWSSWNTCSCIGAAVVSRFEYELLFDGDLGAARRR